MVRRGRVTAYANPVTGVTDCFVIFDSFRASVATPRRACPGGISSDASRRVPDAVDRIGRVVADQQ